MLILASSFFQCHNLVSALGSQRQVDLGVWDQPVLNKVPGEPGIYSETLVTIFVIENAFQKCVVYLL